MSSSSIYYSTFTILYMIFSVTSYLKLQNAITISYTSHFFNQQRSNWLFGNYRTLTCLLGKKYINKKKVKKYVTLNGK